ncbi:dihydrofolate reductase [Robiginitalea aurantiaca]|uniref:Dihydrofolate reductase n=1 Tax=Robiginitalea aurantiaca TaxID=3056915 RepID=A0ABT7WC92_9FLAO|nr:dihydrofolate reductase [Robiginitalea aurantiaca]MDM9630517.1 dihydrofolate reductase [Robiginitalea aurantiaca]
MKDLILIAAVGESNELGKNGDLPWHLPDDFKYFKETTTGHPMIMGRKTFDTFPRPLPNRQHVIISRNKAYTVTHKNCMVVHSLDAALDAVSESEQVFVIGGGEIYKQALPLATRIELTRVHGTFEADTYFPQIDSEKWVQVRSTFHPADQRHKYSFTFQSFIPRINPEGEVH